MFCDTNTQRHKTPLRYFHGKYLVKYDPPYCTLYIVQFYYRKKYIINDEIFCWKDSVALFCL